MRQSTRQKTTYFFWLMYLVIIIYYRRIILKIFMHRILCTVTEDGIFKLIFNICSNHHKKATKGSLSRILSLHIFHQTCLHTIAFAVVVLMIYKKLWPLWNNKHVPTLKRFSFCVCTESPHVSQIQWNPQDICSLSQVTCLSILSSCNFKSSGNEN